MIAGRAEPFAGREAQAGHINTSEDWRKRREFFKRRSDQRFHAGAIAARIVVKCRRQLNESLQKEFLGIGRREPDFLPGLMRFEKLSRIEENDSVLEFFLIRRDVCRDIPAPDKVKCFSGSS